MTFRVRYTAAARDDLRRLYAFLLKRDVPAARRALETIRHSVAILEEFPFTCRKAEGESPFLRELVVPFGSTGYVALFEIEDQQTVTILAVRHQREHDYL